jgi:hypothetical protein
LKQPQYSDIVDIADINYNFAMLDHIISADFDTLTSLPGMVKTTSASNGVLTETVNLVSDNTLAAKRTSQVNGSGALVIRSILYGADGATRDVTTTISKSGNNLTEATTSNL